MIDKPLLAAVMALLTLSLVMSYSLSTYTVVHFHYDDLHFFIRQSISVFIAFLVLILLSKLDAEKWFIPLGLTLFVSFFLLMVVMQFLPATIVKEIGGAKRWIHLGPVSLAPVEFFKVGFVFFLSWSFSRKLVNRKEMRFLEELKAFMPYILIFAVAVLIIAKFQKDLGQVIVLAGTLMILFFLIGSSWKFFMTMFLGLVAGVAGLIIVAPHRMIRIKSWWGSVQDTVLSLLPFESLQRLRIDAVKEPYQISHSLNAIHHGGFFGVGLGNGQLKLGYLSEVHTDFILAGLTEELGYAGLLLVITLLAFVVYRIFQIAIRVKNPMYYLFGIGTGLLIAFAFILNAYGISGMTPIKGIAVPFLSYGGSHIIALCVAIGFVLMLSKQVPRDAQGHML